MAQQENESEGVLLSEIVDNTLSEDEEDECSDNEGDAGLGDEYDEEEIYMDDDGWDEDDGNENNDDGDVNEEKELKLNEDANDDGMRNAKFSDQFCFPLGGWEPIGAVGNGSFVLAVTKRDGDGKELEAKLVEITGITRSGEVQCEDQNRLGTAEMVKTKDIMLAKYTL